MARIQFRGRPIPLRPRRRHEWRALALAACGLLGALATGVTVAPSAAGAATTSPIIETGAGGGAGDGIPATTSPLDAPNYDATDASGGLYVAAPGEERVRFEPAVSGTYFGRPMRAGDLYTVAGDGSGGTTGDADGTPATSAELDTPWGVTVDSAGNLFIADGGAYALMVAGASCDSSCPFGLVSTTAGDLYVIAGTGASGSAGDTNGAAATSAQLDDPRGVAVDSSGDLFVDLNQGQRVVMVAGKDCSTGCPFGLSTTTAGDFYDLAGNGIEAGPGFSSGSYGPSSELNWPAAVAVGPGGNLYVDDEYSDYVLLLARQSCSESCPFDLSSTTAGDLYVVAGGGSSGTSGDSDGSPGSDADLDYAAGIALDPAGNLFVADTEASDALMFAATSCTSSCPFGLSSTTEGDVYRVAGSGVAGASGDSDGSPATSAQLDDPNGVALDPAGDLFITDTAEDEVLMVAGEACSSSCPFGLSATAGGDLYAVAGDGTAAYAGTGVSPTLGGLSYPSGAAGDASGDLYVADTGDNMVRFVPKSPGTYFGQTMSGGEIYTIAGTGVDGAAGDSDGTPATSAELSGPGSVALLDQAGNVYLADGSSFETAGGAYILMVAGTSCQSSCPFGLSSTTTGDLYVIAGNGTAGDAGDFDGSPATSAELSQPDGVALDRSGNLYISDGGEDEVMMVAGSSCSTSCPFGLPSTTVGDLYLIAGTGSYGTLGDRNGAGATSAELPGPTGVATDPAGNLYLTANGGYAMMVAATSCSSSCPFALSSTTAGDLYLLAGTGGDGTSGESDGSPAASAELDDPSGPAVDPSGDLYLADSGGDDVLMIAGTSCASACPEGLSSTTAGALYIVAGNGVEGDSGDGGSPLSAELDLPGDVAVGAAGDLYIVDAGNGVVRDVVMPVAPAFTSLPATTCTVGSPCSFDILSSGTPTPAIGETGGLPVGMSFSATGGTATLSGTPADGARGAYPLQFTASNGVGSGAVQAFTLTVVGGSVGSASVPSPPPATTVIPPPSPLPLFQPGRTATSVPGGRRIELPATCALASCSGTVALSVVRHRDGRVVHVVLARTTYSLGAGQRTVIVLAATSAWRTMLRRLVERTHCRVTAVVRDGATVERVPLQVRWKHRRGKSPPRQLQATGTRARSTAPRASRGKSPPRQLQATARPAPISIAVR